MLTYKSSVDVLHVAGDHLMYRLSQISYSSAWPLGKPSQGSPAASAASDSSSKSTCTAPTRTLVGACTMRSAVASVLKGLQEHLIPHP